MPIGQRYRRDCLLLILAVLCSAMLARCADEDVPPFDVDGFMTGPDRSDFAWKFATYGPHLTMQQRYILGVYAKIDGKQISRTPAGELHFVLKVANAENRWIAEKYTRIPVPHGPDESQDINYSCSLYLRPGRYIVALVVYDAALQRGNVRRKNVKVSLLSKAPLPQLDRNLPEAEFTSESPQDYASRFPNVTNHLDDMSTLVSMEDFTNSENSHRLDFTLGKGKEWLPVNNSRPLSVDIVANISSDYDHNPNMEPFFLRNSFHTRRAKSSDIVRIASVLSHLDLRKGCIRVTITDTLRMKTFFDRDDAADFDWPRAGELISKQNPATIEASRLGSQDQASAYLLEKLNRILEDDACDSAGESSRKIVIVVSRNIEFLAEHARIEQVIPRNPASVRFFYIKVTEGIYKEDDLLKMLKPANPRQFLVLDSFAFRKSLAALISSLEKLK
jgi:hypothetical protein